MERLCIFDLDGTVLNTLDSIAYFVNEALKDYGIEPIEADTIRTFVGSGARNLIMKSLNYRNSELDVSEVLKNYMEKYNKDATYLVTPYEGMMELLDILKAHGVKIAVLSNKPHSSTCLILDKIFGKDYFCEVRGSKDDEPKKPKKKGWFGNAKDLLIGDRKAVQDAVIANLDSIEKKLKDKVKKGEIVIPGLDSGSDTIPNEIIQGAIHEDREGLLKFIHDVYYGYITQCIRDNRLTFGLTELFAFIILVKNEVSRELHSVDYLTIDEFQDTNELQMKICLMLLKKPNMCVVGDWKQGIFGFRYVSIDNITRFGDRIKTFMKELKELNDYENIRIDFGFGPSEPVPIEFDRNYRSSSMILEKSFESLDIPGSKDEIVTHGKVVPLTSMCDEWMDKDTEVACIECKDKDEEVIKTVDMITEYVYSGRYHVLEDKDGEIESRDLRFGDIAVLCRTSNFCTRIYDECTSRGIPAYLQGDLEVMSTREGKLVLAWLRYLNNDKDTRGLTTILTDLGYPLSEIEFILKPENNAVPSNIVEQLSLLRKKKKRPNSLITSIFDFYGLNNGVVQTIINILSSAHKGSLMTISDLIRLIEDDIAASTKYNVEPLLDKRAVTIQTVHTSKGLEYPAVIMPGIDVRLFPSTNSDKESLIFNDNLGVRCKNEYAANEDEGGKHEAIVPSWKTSIVSMAFPTDYSEERRLLFVGMTRPEQYLTLVAGNPSKFFTHYSENCKKIEPTAYDNKVEMSKTTSDSPVIGEYHRKRTSLTAHDLMGTLDEPSEKDKKEGKGKEYGEKVHQAAYLYLKWGIFDEKYPEMGYIRKIIEERRDSKLSAEIRCVLPIDDISIKGTIDLIAEYDDRIEIHDYKTDMDESYIDHYTLQLSIYALAAESMGKRIECFIDFVSLEKTVKVKTLDIGYIKECIEEYRRKLTLPV